MNFLCSYIMWDEQQAKKDFYESFDAKTSTFFAASEPYRSIVSKAIPNMRNAYDYENNKYVPDQAAEWRTDLKKLNLEGSQYDIKDALEAAGLLEKDYELMTEAEKAEFIIKVGDIVSANLPNLSIGDTIKIPIMPGIVFYYRVTGTAKTGSDVTVSKVLSDERALLASMSVSGGIDGLNINYSGDFKSGTFGLSNDKVTVKIPTSLDGVKYSVKVNDNYTLTTSLSAQITSVKAEIAVTSSEKMGSIETAMGIEVSPTSAYAPVPALSPEEIQQMELYQKQLELQSQRHTLPEAPDLSEGVTIATIGAIIIFLLELGSEFVAL